VRLLDVEAHWIAAPESTLEVVLDRLSGGRRRSIAPERRALYEAEWPDLVLLAGGLGAVEACRIRAASEGRSRVVALGRPWAPLGWFDLLVTTPQYQLPKGDNVLQLPVPLNLPAHDGASASGLDPFADLPRPFLGVILGGDSGSYRFTVLDAKRIAGSVNAEVRRAGGAAVVVGSPRTPAPVLDAFRDALDVPNRCFPWQAGATNPYPAVLRGADGLLVTSDSASMLAEAAFTDRPLAVEHLSERPHAGAFRALRRRTPWLSPLRERLTRAGAWVPARDLHRVASCLEDDGRVVPLDGLLDRSSVDTDLASRLCEQVRARVSGLVGARRDQEQER